MRQNLLPGDRLRSILVQHGISQGEFANASGVSRLTVNQIINNHRSITAEVALRIAKVTATDPIYWLKLQQEVDVRNARLKINIQRIPVLVQRKTKYR